jgi:NAD(P)-dependent dehydrogenase (short-subunit alcohol dehydrogenase family)
MSKHIVITGGTSGIGKATVSFLIKEGWKVTLLARNLHKASEMSKKFKGSSIQIVECDLADLSSVKTATQFIKEKGAPIDVLMNNAGGIFQKYQTSKDHFEMTFAVNHLSHFLLTTELTGMLIESCGKIINVSSAAHRMGKLDLSDMNWETRKYQAMKAYGDAKLCNIYFTRELHKRFKEKGISSFSCHPGVVKTNFAGDVNGIFRVLLKMGQPFMISPEKGSQTQLYLATSEGVNGYSGRYFDKQKVASTAPQAMDDEIAVRLWDSSEAFVAPFR